MPTDYDSELEDDFVRREQEREQYYGERYETVLERLKQISDDQERTFESLNTLEVKIDATKAASEEAHKEIIERLGRLEQNMK